MDDLTFIEENLSILGDGPKMNGDTNPKTLDQQKSPKSPGFRTYPFGYADYIKQSTESVRDKGMSTAAQPQNHGTLVEAIASIRSDTSGVDRKCWALVGHVNNDPTVIDVVATDNSADASFDDFCSKLEDDQVMYGLLRLNTTFDMSSTVKFIYVHWIGDNVPFAKKGRFGVVHGSVKEFFSPHHILIETGNRDELTLEELSKKVEDNAMTRSKVLDVDVKGQRQERGFTQHSAVKRQDKGFLRSVAPEGAAIEVADDLQAAMAEVRDDKSEVTWVLAGYEEGNLKKPLTCLAKGDGDLEKMKENLQDDQVMYGLYRTTDQYDNITTVKFVYVYFIGENVKPLTKGKVSAYAGPAEKVFSPAHCTLSVTTKDDLTDDVVNDKVKASSGSKVWEKL